MKSLVKCIWALLVVLGLTGCPDYAKDFAFQNNSDKNIYIELGQADRSFGGSLYPDTIIAKTKPTILISANSKYLYHYNPFEENDTLSLFIYDADTIDAYSWEEIRDGYKILQRYDLDMREIEKQKNTITYPPTEAMKNIKMYPPYKSQ